MARAKKMISLNIDETSGVDHPAHLQEGWLVMKSSRTNMDDLLQDLTKQTTTGASRFKGTEEEPMPRNTEKLAKEMMKPEDEMAAKQDSMPEEDKMSYEDAMSKIKQLEDEMTKMKAELEAEKAKSMPEAELEIELPDEEELMKSAPEAVRKMLTDLRKSADEAIAKAKSAEAALQAERDAQADKDAIAKAKAWSNLPLEAEKIGPALRKLSDLDAELAKSVDDLLTAVNAQAESANIFAEIGKAAPAQSGDAYAQLTSMAKAAVDAGAGVTFEKAFADAVIKNPDLYSKYLTEKGA